MLFELTKEITAGRRNGEIERINAFSSVYSAERAMLEYGDENLPNGIQDYGDGEFIINGNVEYRFNEDAAETWDVGDRTGMACGDFTLWITRIS